MLPAGPPAKPGRASNEGRTPVKVLVALPVFNEEQYVRGVLTHILRLGHDVLVVDDGSTDATAAILTEFRQVRIIRHPENRGYGQSLIDAFRHAAAHGYDWIITIDCDEQHEPRLIPEFVAQAKRDHADIISGSRYLMHLPGNTAAPDDRRHINAHITAMLRERLGLDLTDSFCGFKAHRVSALSRLHLTIPGYAFPMQFWAQVWHHGLRIDELAVPLVYNDPTRHFGGMLDDPEARLRHYLDVFETEMRSLAAAPFGCECGTLCGG